MTTLRDLMDAGITFQGDTVEVCFIQHGIPSVVGRSFGTLYSGDVQEKYLDKEVTFIYQQLHTLVIEINND